MSDTGHDNHFEWRLQIESRVKGNEGAIETLAKASDRQQVFNEEVLKFMSSVRTWGVAVLLIFGAGQIMIAAILEARLG